MNPTPYSCLSSVPTHFIFKLSCHPSFSQCPHIQRINYDLVSGTDGLVGSASSIVSTSILVDPANGRDGPWSGRRPIRHGSLCGSHPHVTCLGQCRMAEPIPLHARPQPNSSYLVVRPCLEHLDVSFIVELIRPGRNESLRNWSNYKQEGLVQFVIDSVYALAHAAHDMLTYHCEEIVRCPMLQRLTGPEFLEFIRNISFTGISGDLVKFNEHGDSLGRYDIYQFQRKGKGDWGYVQVGEWVDRLNLNMSALRWKNGSLQRPTSICSEPCRFGESRIATSECCWMCVPCKENEFLNEEGKCKPCPSDSQPNATLTGCERLPIVALVPTSLWFVLPVAFSLAGVVCTVFTFGVFLVFNKTPIIMASGRELCYILLFGISISYITSVAMLARPSMFTCLIRRFALGVSLCFVYAAILTKTNRIFRIFSVGIKAMVKRPSYTSPKSQIFICLALVSVQ
ncbi:metabotropic glutamate receptor, partial [Plakobranchus ocellatus]